MDSITEEWRRRKNAEIELLFRSTTITDVIKKRRIQWAERVWRSQNGLTKAVTEQKKTAWKIQNKTGGLSQKGCGVTGPPNWKENGMVL